MTTTAYRYAGSYAAFAQAALWFMFAIFIFLINPALGLTTPAALSDPAALLPALTTAPALIIFPGLDLVVGLSLLLVVIRLENLSNRREKLASILGVMASLFFIALATSRIHTLPMLAQHYVQNPTEAGSQFLLLNAIHEGLSAATRLTLGFWLVLTNQALRQTLPHVTGLGILLGLLNIGSVFFPPLAAPNMILMPVWFYRTGRWMLHQTQ